MRRKERERTTSSPVFAKGIRVIARTYKLLGEFKNGKARERERLQAFYGTTTSRSRSRVGS